MKKAIDHILYGREKKITPEETVLQPLPHKDFRFANPFIVLHHLKPTYITPGQKLRIHPHPHRGFAPVTFILQGEGYHKDNAGHYETVKAGDVQWMFAGKGLLHSEGPTEKMLKEGGVQEFIQLWINVPKADKWKDPTYQAARKEELPEILKQDGVHFRLASGSFDGETGPIKTLSPVITSLGEIAKGKKLNLQAIPGYWTLLYLIKGKITVNDKPGIEPFNLIIFEKENSEIDVEALEDSQVLLLSAEPINEPVTAKDNFVMNTAEEIEQAFKDYEAGKFGTLDY